MTGLSRIVTIVNQRGLHARASSKFVTMVAGLPEGCTVTVAKDGTQAVGGSILGLMMLGAARGDTIEVAVGGTGDEAILARLCALVESGFGEE